jgi:hypothetical protein
MILITISERGVEGEMEMDDNGNTTYPLSVFSNITSPKVHLY